jgi:Ankyrin repeat.
MTAPAAQDGATALFKACHKGYSSVVEELLKYKPSLALLPVSTKLVTSIIHSH